MIVAHIKQLSNYNVQFIDPAGNTIDTFFPATTWTLDGDKVSTVSRNQFPFIIRQQPGTLILLEYKDGSTVNFTGDARALYDKFYEPNSFFFDLSTLITAFSPNGKRKVGQRYTFTQTAFTPGTIALVGDTQYYFPVFFDEKVNIQEITLKLDTAGGVGSKFVFGLHEADAENRLKPNGLLVNSSELDGTSTAAQNYIFPASIEVQGLYFLVFSCSDGMTFHSISIDAIPNALGDGALTDPVRTVIQTINAYDPTLPDTPAGPFIFASIDCPRASFTIV